MRLDIFFKAGSVAIAIAVSAAGAGTASAAGGPAWDWRLPFDGTLNISQAMGYATHTGRSAESVDYAMPGKSFKVRAAHNGYVLTVGNEPAGYGRHIVLRTEDSAQVISIYGHLERMLVTQGQYVNAGDVIGDAGKTGNAYGIHLHFEARTGYTGAGTGTAAPVRGIPGNQFGPTYAPAPAFLTASGVNDGQAQHPPNRWPFTTNARHLSDYTASPFAGSTTPPEVHLSFFDTGAFVHLGASPDRRDSAAPEWKAEFRMGACTWGATNCDGIQYYNPGAFGAWPYWYPASVPSTGKRTLLFWTYRPYNGAWSTSTRVAELMLPQYNTSDRAYAPGAAAVYDIPDNGQHTLIEAGNYATPYLFYSLYVARGNTWAHQYVDSDNAGKFKINRSYAEKTSVIICGTTSTAFVCSTPLVLNPHA